MSFQIENGKLIQYHPTPGATAVTVPEGVTAIGAGAFRDCEDLISVTLPEGLEAIGEGAFLNCGSLTDITIPAGVTVIAEETFLGCESLTGITLPKGLVAIGGGAFGWCSSLSSITLPESVEHICINAFEACHNLVEIRVSENNRNYTDIGGALFDKEQKALLLAPGRSGEYRIPAHTKVLGEMAFRSCYGMTGITIPAGVVDIGEDTFYQCFSLRRITICKDGTAHPFYSGRQLQTEDLRMLLDFMEAALPEQEVMMQQSPDPGLTRSMALYLALWQDSAAAWDYLRENSTVIIRDLIDRDLTGLLERLLLSGCLSLNMVERGILYANNNQKYEAQILLTQYKYEQIGTYDPMADLKL